MNFFNKVLMPKLSKLVTSIDCTMLKYLEYSLCSMTNMRERLGYQYLIDDNEKGHY